MDRALFVFTNEDTIKVSIQHLTCRKCPCVKVIQNKNELTMAFCEEMFRTTVICLYLSVQIFSLLK